jgi:16S rRNA (cytidine1402-2'-O)-methyltransferase
MKPGRLILCATPIGNLEDITLRVIRVLSEADVVACEDTRRTRKLLTHHGIEARSLVVYNDASERRQARKLLERIDAGATVALVTDAGMPGLSDPGYRLVRACIDRGITVEVAPGASAAITALALSGLPPARFAFEGFLPRKSGERRRRVEELAAEPRTLVIYESPHRIGACLRDLADILGDRPAVLARELTKLHEEVRRGSLPELVTSVEADPPRGEIVLVVDGARAVHRETDPRALAEAARGLMEDGVERREALGRVARDAGVPKRVVFDALVTAEEE